MKLPIFRTSFFFAAIFLLTSMTSSTLKISKPATQKEFNKFFTMRSLVYASIPELETKYKTKFNFFQKLKINQVKKKISRQLKSENLLDGCDTIKLKNGEEIIAIVNEIGTAEIKYKKCENRNGPSYSMKRSDIYMIRYANGAKDFFGNEKPADENNKAVVNSSDEDVVKTDPLAIASIAAVVVGTIGLFAAAPILTILIPVGIVLGFVSKSKINNSKGGLKGIGYATAGIVGGFVIIALALLAVLLYVSAW